jgi:hypothetical protein
MPGYSANDAFFLQQKSAEEITQVCTPYLREVCSEFTLTAQ